MRLRLWLCVAALLLLAVPALALQRVVLIEEFTAVT